MKIHAVKMLNHSTCFAIRNKWGRNMRQITPQSDSNHTLKCRSSHGHLMQVKTSFISCWKSEQ